MPGPTRYEKRIHPFGPEGIRTSLREVALGMGKGKDEERVLRWTRNVIEDARLNGGFRADSDRKRAELLLRAVQQKVWVPDPVGTEFMASSRLLACDIDKKDEDCFGTGDCDDKSRLLGSAFLSVGLHAVAVGHGYGGDRVGHVLNAVRVGGTWLYADGSTQNPLGEAVPFTHEVVLEPFSGQVICEGKSCLSELPKDLDRYIYSGNFVGVDAPPLRRIRWLGQDQPTVGQTTKQAAETELAKRTRDGSLSRDDAKAVGSVTGAAAAGAACAAVGVPVASPLCAAVGAEIGQFIGGALADAYAAVGTPGSAAPWFELQLVRVYRLHNALYPNDPPWYVNEAISAMIANGMDQRCDYRKNGGVYLRSSFCQQNATEPIVRRVQAAMIAGAADQRARERIGGSKKSSNAPLIIGGLALAGIAWAFFT